MSIKGHILGRLDDLNPLFGKNENLNLEITNVKGTTFNLTRFYTNNWTIDCNLDFLMNALSKQQHIFALFPNPINFDSLFKNNDEFNMFATELYLFYNTFPKIKFIVFAEIKTNSQSFYLIKLYLPKDTQLNSQKQTMPQSQNSIKRKIQTNTNSNDKFDNSLKNYFNSINNKNILNNKISNFEKHSTIGRNFSNCLRISFRK